MVQNDVEVAVLAKDRSRDRVEVHGLGENQPLGPEDVNPGHRRIASIRSAWAPSRAHSTTCVGDIELRHVREMVQNDVEVAVQGLVGIGSPGCHVVVVAPHPRTLDDPEPPGNSGPEEGGVRK